MLNFCQIHGKLNDMKKPDSFLIVALLSLSGGLQDAYTYNVRGHVFANAQTGNVVLMSQHLMSGNPGQAVAYLLPLLAFSSGVIVSVIMENRLKHSSKLYWRHLVLLTEILVLTAVGFFPAPYITIPNMLVSFSCAMQIHSFKEIRGSRCVSTMCIGNITSAMEWLWQYFYKKDRADLIKARNLFFVIGVFAIGAGFGGVLSRIMHTKTIWISSVLLALAAMLMNRSE